MSRAFVSEDAEAAKAAAPPERPVSTGPNLVTARGLALIEAEVARLQAARADSDVGSPERAVLERDLRYWQARRSTATVVPPKRGAENEVAFGGQVIVQRGGGDAVSYRIVGEDEADPARGYLSWTSPMAQALLGAAVGDEVELGGGRHTMTVIGIAAS